MTVKIIFGLLFSALGIFLLYRGLSSGEDNIPQLIAGGVSVAIGAAIFLIGGN